MPFELASTKALAGLLAPSVPPAAGGQTLDIGLVRP
jgi:hypothetical protein